MIWDILSKFVLTLFSFMAIGLTAVIGYFITMLLTSSPVVAVIVGIMFGVAMMYAMMHAIINADY